MLTVLFILSALAVLTLLATGLGRASGPWRLLSGLVATVLAVPVGLAAIIWMTSMRNDLRLARFAAQLDDFPMPAGARRLHRLTDVGILTGNGNHCDFLARHEIATDLALDAVRAHYARLRLRPAVGDDPEGGSPLLWVDPRTGGGYVVTALDAPNAAGLDLRCH